MLNHQEPFSLTATYLGSPELQGDKRLCLGNLKMTLI